MPANVTPPKVEETLSILRKAGDLGNPATLVIGLSGSGKSTLVRNTLATSVKNPLWLALNNTNAISEDGLWREWDVAVLDNWAEFSAGVMKPAKAGALKKYDALVIDGGDILANFAMLSITVGQPSQPDWLAMSNLMRNTLVALRGYFSVLYMTVDVVAGKDQIKKINFNPYAKNNIVPLFGNKWYTAGVRQRGADQKLGNIVSYTVQKNPLLALDFIPG